MNKLTYDAAMDARPASSQTPPHAAPGSDSAEAMARLGALAAALEAHGWASQVHAPRGRMPSLHARNPVPGAAALSERIYALPRADGTWMFWWPWDQPIAETPVAAAAVIIRVLRPAEMP